MQPRAPGQFHHPHFLIAGFPKCATTSMFCHLIQHPQIQHPAEKEPHTLLDHCDWPLECSADVQREYLRGVSRSRGKSRCCLDGLAALLNGGFWRAGRKGTCDRSASSFDWPACLQVLNGGDMAETMFTKASFEGSTHYAVVRACLPACLLSLHARRAHEPSRSPERYCATQRPPLP